MNIRAVSIFLASLLFFQTINSNPCSAEEVVATVSTAESTAVSAEKPRFLDQFTDSQLTQLLEGIKAAGAYGPSGISGSLRSVADAVNQFPYTHQDIQPTDQPATHSVPQLRQGLLSLRNSITTLEISFLKTVVFEQPDAKIKTRQLHYAFQGLRQYLEDADVLPDGSLTSHNVNVYDGKEGRQLSKTLKEASQGLYKPQFLAQEVQMYLQNIPVFVGPCAAGHEPHEDVAALLFDYEALCRVLPTLETVDGAPCHVVVCPLGFLFWIEVKDHTCNLRRVAEFRMEGEQNALVLNRILAHHDFRQIGAGLEWPFKTRETYFEDVLPDGTRYQDDSLFSDRYLTKEYTVTDLKRNNSIAAGLFQLSFPPDTLVADLIQQRYYRNPDDPQDLADAIKEGSPILADGIIPDWKRIRFGEPPGYLEQIFHSKWIFCGCLIIVLLLAWVVNSCTSSAQREDS
ncbi:hypothetical protein [uncultured Gimesia sp.]|uniref:hypothetical protein n=1 Tax=uncultured Gimesia sp. TaxID=1678688 RepID=UPI0030DC6663|tara:strand:- start:352 stop:1722 length:1371 start_codon:yes stop_codon:yes gene_type:complete